jgi:putative transposase
MPIAEGTKEQCSMDFMRNQLAGARALWLLTVTDHFTREPPAIEVDHGLPGARVVRLLGQLAVHREPTRSIRLENGLEFTGRASDEWAH